MTVRAGGPGGHYAALRDNTTLETPPLAVATGQQVLLITARAPVGAPLLHVTALLDDGTPRSLGELRPTASWDTFAFNAAGLTGRSVRLVLDPVMGRTTRVDLARVGESEQVAAGMRLVRGAARRATGLPAGALLTAGAGPFELRTGLFRVASDAATVSVWIRGIGGLRPSVTLSAGGRVLGSAVAGKSWRAVRVPIAALRGRRVSLAVASSDAAGLQLAYVGTVQRAPALHVVRFVPPPADAPPGSPDRRRRDRLARAHRRARDARAAQGLESGQRVGAGKLKVKGARVVLKVKLPRARRGARRLHGQRGGGGRHLARAHPPGVIAHLDLDAFFAAVEQLDRPELRGKPIVVGGDPRSRGVVSTASYEARAFGIRSAMSAAEAYRRCPSAIFVRPDMARYRERSRTVWEIVASLVERFEQVGIDEGYLDLTGSCASPRTPARCSARCRPPCATRPGSRARSAAAPARPSPRSRATTASPAACSSSRRAARRRSWRRCRCARCPASGRAASSGCSQSGLATIGDLARQDDDALAALGMGKVGRDLRERARGVDPRPVVVEASDPVTIGEETTFDHDLLDPLAMAAELAPIAENVFGHVERRGFAARTVTTKLRYSDFAIVTRSRTLQAPVASAAVLASLAVELLDKALADRRAPVRLLGVYVGKLAREAQLELPLEYRSGSDEAGRDALVEMRVRRAVLALGHRAALARLALARERAAAPEQVAAPLELGLGRLDDARDHFVYCDVDACLLRDREVAPDLLEQAARRAREVAGVGSKPFDRALTGREDAPLCLNPATPGCDSSTRFLTARKIARLYWYMHSPAG